jgi:hypothetical protein
MWLTIRTDTLENAMATIALICMINRGKISIRQARNYDLQRKYMSCLNPQSKQYKRGATQRFARMAAKCALK